MIVLLNFNRNFRYATHNENVIYFSKAKNYIKDEFCSLMSFEENREHHEDSDDEIDIDELVRKLYSISLNLQLGEYPKSRIEHIKTFVDTITGTSPEDDNDFKRMKKYLVLGWYFHEALKNNDQINFIDNNGDLSERGTHF